MRQATRRIARSLTQLYRTYVNNPNDPRPVQPSPTAEYEQAINDCAKGNTAAGIPPLENVLRNNKFTLPPRYALLLKPIEAGWRPAKSLMLETTV